MTGIYVVDVPDEPGFPGRSLKARLVILAESAQEAETIALLARVPAPLRDDPTYAALVEVGRLGTYDPGIAGARLADGSAIVSTADRQGQV